MDMVRIRLRVAVELEVPPCEVLELMTKYDSTHMTPHLAVLYSMLICYIAVQYRIPPLFAITSVFTHVAYTTVFHCQGAVAGVGACAVLRVWCVK